MRAMTSSVGCRRPSGSPPGSPSAARECANAERGPDGPWGEYQVLTVFAGGQCNWHTIPGLCAGIAATLTPDTTPYLTEALARAAMEAGGSWWLLEPDIGVRARVARFWLIRASGAGAPEAVALTDPGAPPGTTAIPGDGGRSFGALRAHLHPGPRIVAPGDGLGHVKVRNCPATLLAPPRSRPRAE